MPPFCLFILLILFPYVVAWESGDANMIFGGFLLNPIDGNSYLAKMAEGARGSWLFYLPYTAQPGTGSLLFLFYLFLGHLARIFHLPLLLTYHIARIAGGIILFWAIVRLVERLRLPTSEKSALLWWLAIGSGMGWIVSSGSKELPVDLWVAETYPFMSAYTNPHFPISLALMLFILEPVNNRIQQALHILFALFLSIILPFGSVIILIVDWGEQFVHHLRKEPTNWRNPLLLAIATLPILIYDQLIVRIDPVLAIWNAQNQTPSPSLGILFLAFLPGLPFAIYCFIKVIQQKRDDLLALAIWMVAGFLALIIPLGLQRRFMLGLYIPVTCLAVAGLSDLLKKRRKLIGIVLAICVFMTLPSNLIVLGSAWYGIQNHDSSIYLFKSERDSFQWIAQNTNPDAVILAGPETGLLIPAYTGRRVLYGHPFETVNSSLEKKFTEDYYSGKIQLSGEELYRNHSVEYVYYGPREQGMGQIINNTDMRIVYNANGVVIYAVQ